MYMYLEYQESPLLECLVLCPWASQSHWTLDLHKGDKESVNMLYIRESRKDCIENLPEVRAKNKNSNFSSIGEQYNNSQEA